jgi:hypothetical protein
MADAIETVRGRKVVIRFAAKKMCRRARFDFESKNLDNEAGVLRCSDPDCYRARSEVRHIASSA